MLVITRDAVIVIGTALLHYMIGQVQVKPSWMGKTATALQMVAISMVLLQWNFFEHTVQIAGQNVEINFLDIPVTLAGIFTLISGIGYVMRGIRQFQASGHGDKSKVTGNRALHNSSFILASGECRAIACRLR